MNIVKHQGLYNIDFITEAASFSARFGEGQFQPLSPSQQLTTYPPINGLGFLRFKVSTNFGNTSPVLSLKATLICDQERHDITIICSQTNKGYEGDSLLHFYGVPTNNRCPSIRIHFNEVATGDFLFKPQTEYKVSIIAELSLEFPRPN